MDRLESIKERYEQVKSNPYTYGHVLGGCYVDDVSHLLQRLERYEEAFKHIDNAIHKRRSNMNHMENTEHEKGQISGLNQAHTIVEGAFKKARMSEEDEKREQEVHFLKSIELLKKLKDD